MENISHLLLLFGVGTLAGFINVMAGGGSSITLPILIFLGLDSALANGTNRVALIIQNISAITSFKQEKYSQFPQSLKLSALTLPGAVIGAIVATRIDNLLFQKILAVVMIGIMITIVMPDRKNKAISAGSGRQSPWIYPAMMAIGFYGGFIQVGVGFLFMAALRHLLSLDLIRVNMHKVFIIFVYTWPALLIFFLTGNVNWVYGLVLGAGNAFGAWWSVKLSVRRGEKIIRLFLVLAMLIMAAKLLRVF